MELLWLNSTMLIHSASQLLTLRGGPQRGRDLGTLNIIENGAVLIRNEQIVYYSDYYNASADTVYMGPHVENQEHSNLFMVYWPGPANGKTIYDVDQGW